MSKRTKEKAYIYKLKNLFFPDFYNSVIILVQETIYKCTYENTNLNKFNFFKRKINNYEDLYYNILLHINTDKLLKDIEDIHKLSKLINFVTVDTVFFKLNKYITKNKFVASVGNVVNTMPVVDIKLLYDYFFNYLSFDIDKVTTYIKLIRFICKYPKATSKIVREDINMENIVFEFIKYVFENKDFEIFRDLVSTNLFYELLIPTYKKDKIDYLKNYIVKSNSIQDFRKNIEKDIINKLIDCKAFNLKRFNTFVKDSKWKTINFEYPFKGSPELVVKEAAEKLKTLLENNKTFYVEDNDYFTFMD